MKTILKYAFIFFGILFSFPILLYGQTNRLDSLNNALKSAKSDTTKLHLLVQLSEECDVPDIMKYGQPALELADKLLQESGYSEKENLKKIVESPSIWKYIMGILKINEIDESSFQLKLKNLFSHHFWDKYSNLPLF